jgi:hypothetical protein
MALNVKNFVCMDLFLRFPDLRKALKAPLYPGALHLSVRRPAVDGKGLIIQHSHMGIIDLLQPPTTSTTNISDPSYG